MIRAGNTTRRSARASEVVIAGDASDGEIRDAVEELLERCLGLPVTLGAMDVRTVCAAIEAERRRLRKQPRTRRTANKAYDERFG